MINQNFIFLGFAIELIGSLSYVQETVKGRVKPNRISWLLWTLAPMIAFFAEIEQGVGLQSLLAFTVGFGPLLVFIASFVNKKSEWKLGKLDYICASLSLIGLLFWMLTKIGNTAIIFSILADATAAIPTLIKSFKFPETESPTVFLFGGINAAITLLTVKVWNFATYAFPIYILIICTVLVLLIRFKIGKIFKK